MHHRPLSVFLDAVRLIAAFAVVVGHARLVTFGQRAGEMEWLAQAVYQTGSFAHMAVTIFFVISGYLVGAKLYDAGKPGFVARYALDRATRIYVVALPVLVIAFISVTIQNAVFGQALNLGPGTCRPGGVDLFRTLAMLHDGFTVENCFDGPVWSLVYEVFYYGFFGSVAVAWFRRGDRVGWAATAVALVLGIYGLFEPKYMLALSTIWILGMAAAHPTPLKGRGLAFLAAALGLFALQAVIRTDTDVKQEVAATLVTILMILVLRNSRDRPVPDWAARAATMGAAFSYSLYLAHAPAMNLAKTVANNVYGMGLPIGEMAPKPMIAWLVFTGIGVLAGLLSWWCFERHTGDVRRWLATRLGIPRPTSGPSGPGGGGAPGTEPIDAPETRPVPGDPGFRAANATSGSNS